ncbi:notch-regulated ankyrin repeat-containing protein [Biomphalaria pfeifferi]|uniref:Notch-regulated ankyrin repeat-containing protein n=1 Tax=Biomphalaria pfeifferi TaxID=112525 RepID=A0AAD8C2P4_BIOPF|nr:notch-regulated ankyrin repeat-containing protein [Biomphalaria pfeifferi]
MNDSRVGRATPSARAERICAPSPILLDSACSPPPSASSSSSLASTAPPSSTSNAPLTPPPTPPTLSSPCQMTFREAVQNGDYIELQRILEEREGKINVNLFDTEGQTALHHSCLQGNLELVKLLVRFGADVRLANRDGWNPLHIAAYGGHNDIFLFLMAVRRS